MGVRAALPEPAVHQAGVSRLCRAADPVQLCALCEACTRLDRHVHSTTSSTQCHRCASRAGQKSSVGAAHLQVQRGLQLCQVDLLRVGVLSPGLWLGWGWRSRPLILRWVGCVAVLLMHEVPLLLSSAMFHNRSDREAKQATVGCQTVEPGDSQTPSASRTCMLDDAGPCQECREPGEPGLPEFCLGTGLTRVASWAAFERLDASALTGACEQRLAFTRACRAVAHAASSAPQPAKRRMPAPVRSPERPRWPALAALTVGYLLPSWCRAPPAHRCSAGQPRSAASCHAQAAAAEGHLGSLVGRGAVCLALLGGALHVQCLQTP